MTEFEGLAFESDEDLLPAVVQSVRDGQVRMVGYMNRASLRRTLETGRVTFYSRSRDELWEKGESSGDWLEVKEVRADCDGDALLVRASPHGPTCHTGAASCFQADSRPDLPSPRRAHGGAGRFDGPGNDSPGAPDDATAARDGPPSRPGAALPSGSPARSPTPGGRAAEGPAQAAPSPAPVLVSVLEELIGVVAQRDRERPEGSYTSRLLEAGEREAAKKVAEEGVEVALALDDLERLTQESADLLYHLLVLWRSAGLNPEAVGEELVARGRPAGGQR